MTKVFSMTVTVRVGLLPKSLRARKACTRMKNVYYFVRHLMVTVVVCVTRYYDEYISVFYL